MKRLHKQQSESELMKGKWNLPRTLTSLTEGLLGDQKAVQLENTDGQFNTQLVLPKNSNSNGEICISIKVWIYFLISSIRIFHDLFH